MDNVKIEECPVIRPTAKEFENFREFVENLDQLYKKQYGMVRIIPPKGWIPRQKDYEKKLENLVISSPIEQNTFGKGGIYECLHIPKKSMSFAEFKSKARELDKITEELTTNEVEEMVSFIQVQFWKNVTFSAPLYGADLLNSLMDENSKAWNLNNLNSVLNDAMTNKIKGINTPYCYVGSWKAFFCWHTEDLDLSGINFIHEGKSKFWYAINHLDKHIIEKQVQRLFPEHFSSCKQFLRHKTTLINPYYLKKKYPELRISKTQHKQNEFMIVFGGSYHCGFNFGFNIAEAINYATVDWLRQIVEVKSCQCVKSSVRASEYEIYKNLMSDPKISKTKQFLTFQEYIFKKAEEDESEQQLEEAKKGVSLQFSKKIKKANRAPKKIVFKNEQYDIQNWGQCDKCRLWRIVSRPLSSNESFECKASGKQCFKKEKVDKKVFTIKI